jgi:hypothetical protein
LCQPKKNSPPVTFAVVEREFIPFEHLVDTTTAMQAVTETFTESKTATTAKTVETINEEEYTCKSMFAFIMIRSFVAHTGEGRFGAREWPSLKVKRVTMASPVEACSPLTTLVSGVVTMNRGGCPFWEKILHAQEAGASFAIIINSEGAASIDAMACSEPECLAITIPSLVVEFESWQRVKSMMNDSPESPLQITCSNRIYESPQDGPNVGSGQIRLPLDGDGDDGDDGDDINDEEDFFLYTNDDAYVKDRDDDYDFDGDTNFRDDDTARLPPFLCNSRNSVITARGVTIQPGEGRFGMELWPPVFTSQVRMASPSSGCSQLDFAVDGGIIVIERGGCKFWEKVLNGENAGADMVVIINTPGAEPIAAMLCHLPGCVAITIPSFIIESHEWDALNLILTAVPSYALTISCTNSPLNQRGTVALQPEYTTAGASTFTVPTITPTTVSTTSTTSSATTATATYPMWSKCNTLGLKMRYNNRVCAISKDADGLCHNGGNRDHSSAVAICSRIGARLCSLDEVQNRAARGAGCKLNKLPIWTSTACHWNLSLATNGSAVHALGHVISIGGGPNKLDWTAGNDSLSTCSSDSSANSSVRCCIDDTPAEVSTLSCTELGWVQDTLMPNVCSDHTEGGACDTSALFSEAVLTCERAGSRICTSDELLHGVSRTSSCDNSHAIWSATPCDRGGFLTVSGGATTCSNHAATLAAIVCCADAAFTSNSTSV